MRAIRPLVGVIAVGCKTDIISDLPVQLYGDASDLNIGLVQVMNKNRHRSDADKEVTRSQSEKTRQCCYWLLLAINRYRRTYIPPKIPNPISDASQEETKRGPPTLHLQKCYNSFGPCHLHHRHTECARFRLVSHCLLPLRRVPPQHLLHLEVAQITTSLTPLRLKRRMVVFLVTLAQAISPTAV